MSDKENFLYSLEDACKLVFAGVGACSPEIYEEKLKCVAKMTNRSNDKKLQDDIFQILREMPCPLD